jgi:hypothetical protein
MFAATNESLVAEVWRFSELGELLVQELIRVAIPITRETHVEFFILSF